MRRQYTDEQRFELIDLVTTGRTTIREAAARLEVTPSTASYRVRTAAKPITARKAQRAVVPATALLITAPAFARLVHAADTDSTIKVRIDRAEIEVRRGFDVQLLRAVVEALSGGAA